MMNARYFQSAGDKVQCVLCPHRCVIADGGTGFCAARYNSGGVLIAGNYGRVTSLALDPIEKKPLYKFHPGSGILSIGSYGCNMRCTFCQNHHISQSVAESEFIPPEELARLSSVTPDNIGVAFTYNEPLISIEYILDAAPLIHHKGQLVVLVSNGQINEEPLADLVTHVDAWNIDLKAFTPEFYRKHGGELTATICTIEAAARVSHVEVTTLVIPGENDSDDEVAALTEWLGGISPDIPYHLSRFFPRHRMTGKQPTPKQTLYRLSGIAKRRLNHVYMGNV